ncbi:glycosyltransferase family 1 protein [Rhabdochromatium marinum]|uniref:glycosyltransferase family 1 protein n=1 Tax=Rhabdochromatium marinum TaxID=48729 RepID=UPI001F5BF398|nr:glycosyltransferase family 1 protein [Rhabdochromatium marinum]
MDDDLFDLGAAHGTPLRYRLKLARLATRRQRWLKAQRAELWVSTPYLQDKYAAWQPRLVQPFPLAKSPSAPGPDPSADEYIRLFYHGSASHQAEIDWLYPVIQAALATEPRLSFEIIGAAKVNRRYRHLPRTTVIHPMSWPNYQSFLAMPGRHIGLAPLLDNPFNRARSCTKFFDITRAGAVGIYSPGPVCRATVNPGVNGLVVPLVIDKWVQAIIELARDAILRQRLIQAAANHPPAGL